MVFIEGVKNEVLDKIWHVFLLESLTIYSKAYAIDAIR